MKCALVSCLASPEITTVIWNAKELNDRWKSQNQLVEEGRRKPQSCDLGPVCLFSFYNVENLFIYLYHLCICLYPQLSYKIKDNTIVDLHETLSIR